VTVLSLDTTTREGSTAVVRDGRVLHELAGDPGIPHGQRLPGGIQDVLDAADVRLEEVDLFAVAAGPGSFTGLRVGIATMQGLAMARGRRIVPVSVLDALGHVGAASGQQAGAWMDAQRGQVFAALYGSDGRELVGPTALSPAETLAAWRQQTDLRHVRFIGDGAVRYADALREQAGDDVTIELAPLLAGTIGLIAEGNPSAAVLPHAVVPIYIRRPDVELARERKLGAQP
jgi:tRNA threonylcarbamoyladenosine biosynthesis protein TsaB